MTCAVFSQSGASDQIVSGSDDRSVKVWDLRNMRAPTTNIQTQSAVNRLDVSSSSGMVAIPQDNRQVIRILFGPFQCWFVATTMGSWKSGANSSHSGLNLHNQISTRYGNHMAIVEATFFIVFTFFGSFLKR